VRLAVIVVLFAAGCGAPSPVPPDRLAECFADAAYACVVAETKQDAAPAECCGKCNNTGKVLSGDRLALVDCDCDPSCPCKSGNKKQCGPECEKP
jgi:hypothetical protein